MMRDFAQYLVDEDNARFSPEMRAENDEYARNLASYYAQKFTAGGPGSMADENIGRIAEIRSLGGAGALAPAQMSQVIRFRDDADLGSAIVRDGVYFDPVTNNPIAIQGPEVAPQFQGANTPNTAQAANAPHPQNASSWISANLPQPKAPSPTAIPQVFGGAPQTDITLHTTNFAQRLRELDNFGLGQLSPNIRSAEELQRVTDYIIKKAQSMGKPLYLKDESGVNRVSTNPGVAEVMQLLRMSEGEKSNLANALFQLEAAQPSAARKTYQSRSGEPTKGIIFDAPEAIDGSMAATTDIAKIPAGSTIKGPGGKRVNIRTQLQQLDSPDAQKPLIGQIQGEKPRVNRRKPGNMGSGAELSANILRQAQERAKGKPIDKERTRANIVKARLAEERLKRDNRREEERQRRATAPKQRIVYGDGAAQRQVENDARRQSEDMALSDLIRRMRQRRAGQ